MSGETIKLEAPGSSLPEKLYLFDEHNRAFLEYRSHQVYPYRPPLVEEIYKALALAAVTAFLTMMIFSLYSMVRLAAVSGTNPVQLVVSVLLMAGLVALVVVVARLYIYSLRTERQGQETLIQTGKIIFVPIEKCTLIRYWRRPPPIMRLRCTFESPLSGRTITRSFAAGWPPDGHCLAVGTPIAILFQNYRNFRVL
jgi:hypothetical protein